MGPLPKSPFAQEFMSLTSLLAPMLTPMLTPDALPPASALFSVCSPACSPVLAFVTGPDAMLISGILLATVGLLRMAYVRRRRARQGARLSPEEMLERNRQIRGTHGDLEQLMSEIEQLTRRFSAQLDAKSRRVERLVEQADERIQRLMDLEDQANARIRDAQAGGVQAGNGQAGTSRVGHAQPSTHPSTHSSSPSRRAESPTAGTQATAEARTADSSTEADGDLSHVPTDPLADSVYQLADDGLGPEQIARQLDEHVGKVELILALRAAS